MLGLFLLIKAMLAFSPEAWEDYVFWQTTNDAVLQRINLLLKDILRSPRDGLGKPEALKWGLSGCWSRRIDREHRLVYRMDGSAIHILSCRYQY